MSSSPTSITNNRSRVKLYTLNDERQWDDRGTGFVTCLSPTNTTNSHSIIVKSEVDGTTLLESQIQLHTKYQKQQVIDRFAFSFLHLDLFCFVLFLFLGNFNCLVRRRKL